MKYEKLELAPNAEPVSNNEQKGVAAPEVHDPELPPQIDADDVIEEQISSAKERDTLSESNTNGRRDKLARKLLLFTLYSIAVASLILISFALYMVN